MKEIIVVENKYKLVSMNLDWKVYRFDMGGNKTKNNFTGEEFVTEPKWVAMDAYFNKTLPLSNPLKFILTQLSQEGDDITNLEEAVQRVENAYKNIESLLKK